MQQLETPFTIQNETARKAMIYLASLLSTKTDLSNGIPTILQGNCVGAELWLHNEPASIVAAGFLHQVFNEEAARPIEIEKEFGKEVRTIIEAVSYSGPEYFALMPEAAWKEVLARIERQKENYGPALIVIKSFTYQLRFMAYLERGDAQQQLYDLSKRCLGVGRRNLPPKHYAITELQDRLTSVRNNFPTLDDK